MRKFIVRVLFLGVIFIFISLIIVYLTSQKVKKRNFRYYNTESCLLPIKPNTFCDIAFMGISHARIFSRDKNHLRVEKILKKKIINISRTGASCGVNEQEFYLSYVYSKNVKIGTVVYVASPSLLFGGHLNEISTTFEIEPFEIDFFTKYLFYNGDNKGERLFNYCRSKLTPQWFRYFPQAEEANLHQLTKIDSANVERGLKLTYSFGDTYNDFLKNCNRVEKTIKIAKSNNSNIIFIIPPSLFGKWPGHKETLSFLKKMKAKYNTNYYDFSESVLNPQYYYDSHHLNSFGIVYFTNKFLKPIINTEPKRVK